MKYKILAAALIVLAACNKNPQKNNNSVTDPEIRGKSYFAKSDAYPYQGMPPMVSVPGGERDALQLLLADSTLNSIVKNAAATWQDADREYETLHKGVIARKQQLAYVILAHKNLAAATGAEALARKKFYITELVNTGYKGYCLLYYALKSLPAAERPFADEMATAISRYGAADTDAPVILKSDFSKIADARMRQKQLDVQTNYSYIEKLRLWQQESVRR